MTREELEHIIRASGDITDQYEFVIVGSQSILGAVPRPEDVFTVSMEADIYPLQAVIIAPMTSRKSSGCFCTESKPNVPGVTLKRSLSASSMSRGRSFAGVTSSCCIAGKIKADRVKRATAWWAAASI